MAQVVRRLLAVPAGFRLLARLTVRLRVQAKDVLLVVMQFLFFEPLNKPDKNMRNV